MVRADYSVDRQPDGFRVLRIRGSIYCIEHTLADYFLSAVPAGEHTHLERLLWEFCRIWAGILGSLESSGNRTLVEYAMRGLMPTFNQGLVTLVHELRLPEVTLAPPPTSLHGSTSAFDVADFTAIEARLLQCNMDEYFRQEIDAEMLRTLRGGDFPQFATSARADPDADKKALQVSKELLLKCLTQEQREAFTQQGAFSVRTPTGRMLRITQARTFNVIDERGSRFCAAPKNATLLPIFDIMLAQKLTLETNPASFFQVANRRGTEPAMDFCAYEIYGREGVVSHTAGLACLHFGNTAV